jgi:hypothetical protein
VEKITPSDVCVHSKGNIPTGHIALHRWLLFHPSTLFPINTFSMVTQ